MARTAITVQEVTSGFPITADGPDSITFAAMDVANGNYYTATGREVILVMNTSVDTAYDFTIQGQPVDRKTVDTVHEIPFGDTAVYFLNPRGFRKSNRQVELDAENAALEIAVIRLPG